MSNDLITTLISNLYDRANPTNGRLAESFGARPNDHGQTSLRDNRAALQEAIDWSAASGRTVFFGGGVYGIDGTLRLRSNCSLVGIGSHNTRLVQLNTEWPDCVVSEKEFGVGTSAVTLSGLSIDGGWDKRATFGAGEKWQYASEAMTQRGLVLASSLDFSQNAENNRDRLGDPYNHLNDILIQNVAGSGLVIKGRGEIRLQGIDIRYCANWGADVGAFDCWLDAASISTCGRGGLLIRDGNQRVSNVKCWFIGMNSTEEYGVGIEIEAPSSAIVGTNITTQDTWGTAFKLGGRANHIMGNAETTGTLFNRWGYGLSERRRPIYTVELHQAQDVRADITVTDRFAGTKGAGLPRLVGIFSASSINNRVVLTIDESHPRIAPSYDTITPVYEDHGSINAKRYNIVETHTGRLFHGMTDAVSLSDADHGVNGSGAKSAGTTRWDTTARRPVWARGSAPTDAWVDAAGTIVIEPKANRAV